MPELSQAMGSVQQTFTEQVLLTFFSTHPDYYYDNKNQRRNHPL